MKQTNRTLSILLAILMLFSVATTAMAAGGLTLESAKVGDTDLKNASVSRNAEITLTFSNNVTDPSVLTTNLSKIKITDSTGTEAALVPSTVEDNNKVIILPLNGIAKGSYTLTIGKEFAAKNGNTLGTKIEIPFNVGGGNNSGDNPSNPGSQDKPLSFVSATVDGKDLANATVAPDAAITITFDRGMTDKQAENFANITLWNAKNEKVAADAYQFADFKKEPKQEGLEHQNSYTIMTLKNLAAGSYTLKLGKDLEANNGNKLGEDVPISFTVKGADNDKSDFIRNILDAVANFFKTIINFFKGLFNK